MTIPPRLGEQVLDELRQRRDGPVEIKHLDDGHFRDVRKSFWPGWIGVGQMIDDLRVPTGVAPYVPVILLLADNAPPVTRLMMYGLRGERDARVPAPILVM